MFRFTLVSSLENPMIDTSMDAYPALARLSVLRGETFSLQLLYTYEPDGKEFRRTRGLPKLEGKLAPYVTLYNVESVPVTYPLMGFGTGDDFIRETPDLYPDVLAPLTFGNTIVIKPRQLKSMWMEFRVPEDAPEMAGECPLTVTVTDTKDGAEIGRVSIVIDVIDAVLPPQRLKVTQWLTASSLTKYYHVTPLSEEYWQILENFIRTATENGINMQYAPLFLVPSEEELAADPSLGEYITTRRENGEYSFSWKNLDRWIDICNRCGVTYLEIPHLVYMGTDCPLPSKSRGLIDGKIQRILEGDCGVAEHKRYLRALFSSMVAHLKERGDDRRTHFHICDEPSEAQLPIYAEAKAWLMDIIGEYTIMDALSSYEFYKQGVLTTPVPISNRITPFIEGGVKDLWTYYCLGQSYGHSNRYISMPSWRNRSMGMQMYKYAIVGFLHWGYNYYGNMEGSGIVNPFRELSGEGWVPAGDAFSVYPGEDRKALPSLRLLVFNEGIEDTRAMDLAESLCGKDAVVKAMEEAFGGEIRFNTCAKSTAQMLAVREAVNALIRANR